MALADADLVAVWSSSLGQIRRTTVGDIAAKAPAPPTSTLSAVLTAGNLSNGKDLIISDATGESIVELNADGSDNKFNNKTIFVDNVVFGDPGTMIIRSEVGEIINTELSSVGNTSDGNAFVAYQTGTTISNVLNKLSDTPTQTVVIRNDGSAYFAGHLEAASIDGGVYATDA